VPECQDVAAFEYEAAYDASHNDERTDYLNHEWPSTHEL
jgi:hypothetical protein